MPISRDLRGVPRSGEVLTARNRRGMGCFREGCEPLGVVVRSTPVVCFANLVFTP